jgi:hypothetical protein
MANQRRPGLPSDFDLPVSGSDLARKPARLTGYLEKVQVGLAQANLEAEEPMTPERQEFAQALSPVTEAKVAQRTIPAQPIHVETLNRRVGEPQPAQHYQAPSRTGKRAQINLPPDIKQKLIEMSRLFSLQTNGQEINRSDIVIGLILALYEVKDRVTVGVLPNRGKWGSQTANQIGPALTLAFQEALSSNSAEDQFRKLGAAANS